MLVGATDIVGRTITTGRRARGVGRRNGVRRGTAAAAGQREDNGSCYGTKTTHRLELALANRAAPGRRLAEGTA
jgi:hypothetical protein